MSVTSGSRPDRASLNNFANWGIFWLTIATIGAALYFQSGLGVLLEAWQKPEYSHGPLIPILSLLLFLRQLKTVPENPGPVRDRWVGVVVLAFAFTIGAIGKLANIPDVVTYATIIWVGGILLVSFGWKTGKHFWPPVVHLAFMLPLPGLIYFKVSTWLQFVSSELGVFFLQLFNVPVYLEGNIIDLGVLRLQVAEACSGLRYLFPILSFSYIFAVLYRGPMWHKAVLLLSAAPITVLMNSIRIAVAGLIAQYYGVEWLEGFTHFFEGWVIFITCIVILFFLARILLFFQPEKIGLTEALDLETDGLATQAARIRLVQPSAAMVTAAAIGLAGISAFQVIPDRNVQNVERDSFAVFPRSLGEWQQRGTPQTLEASVVEVLAADDYHSVTFARPGDPEVGFFTAWYADLQENWVHSPEICLPGSGWEIAWIERTDLAAELGTEDPFNVNRVIIQRGEVRMMVYYWFQHGDRRIAWDLMQKVYLMLDGVRTGSVHGGIVRLTTLIDTNESEAEAEARLQDILSELMGPLQRFFPPY